MDDLKLKTAEFEKRSIPYDDPNLIDKSLAAMTPRELANAEAFVVDTDEGRVNAFINSMTAEKIRHMKEMGEQRYKARLAISRWNFVAKSIKYSFLSLMLSMTAGYLLGSLLLDTIYDPFDILSGYVGVGWMKCWFMALFMGAAHNIYDSLRFVDLVKKVNKFVFSWLDRVPNDPSDKAGKKGGVDGKGGKGEKKENFMSDRIRRSEF